jgi:hypothetical protein
MPPCRATGVPTKCRWRASPIRQYGHVHVTFVRAKDGAPYARLTDEWHGFNEALWDAVGPLPPIGSPEESLSTYWIDRALRVVRSMSEAGQSGLVQGGNAASVVIKDGQVIARSDYEMFDDEAMPVGDFEGVLEIWRRQVVRVREVERPLIPETYRRVSQC